MSQWRRIKDSLKYRDLGGKQFYIEFEVSKNEVVEKALIEGNWACYNFMDRRPDFNRFWTQKLYYGKVGALGYIIAEDELE